MVFGYVLVLTVKTWLTEQEKIRKKTFSCPRKQRCYPGEGKNSRSTLVNVDPVIQLLVMFDSPMQTRARAVLANHNLRGFKGERNQKLHSSSLLSVYG